ncbi:MAG TPA: CPBP family intramembrane glutamic endopeptidase [Myxococcota bacterium]|nr:CPBP family intramembrane glutamic endopeptidase [Myxococcota bacterium]
MRRGALGLGFTALAMRSTAARADSASLGELAASALGFELALALLAFAFAARSPLGVRARLGLGKGALPRSALALLALGTLALSFALDGAYQRLDPATRGTLHEFEAELAGIRGGALARALLSFALVPSIAEELFCRGLLQRGLSARWGPIPAILLAALAFGALHVDPTHALFASALGVYLGAIAHLARSVRAAIGCHLVNNAAAILGAAFAPAAGATFAPEVGAAPAALPLAAAGLSLGALGWCWRRFARERCEPSARLERASGLQNGAGSVDA